MFYYVNPEIDVKTNEKIIILLQQFTYGSHFPCSQIRFHLIEHENLLVPYSTTTRL
jgi:hypothetical protein